MIFFNRVSALYLSGSICTPAMLPSAVLPRQTRGTPGTLRQKCTIFMYEAFCHLVHTTQPRFLYSGRNCKAIISMKYNYIWNNLFSHLSFNMCFLVSKIWRCLAEGSGCNTVSGTITNTVFDCTGCLSRSTLLAIRLWFEIGKTKKSIICKNLMDGA